VGTPKQVTGDVPSGDFQEGGAVWRPENPNVLSFWKLCPQPGLLLSRLARCR
jgi:hypothetical protein